MIVWSEAIKLPVATEQILQYLKGVTVQPYAPISCGYTHSHELKDLPDFRLMDGVVVPPHGDGVAGYRALLMLHNPSNNYVIRGVSPRGPQQRVVQGKKDWPRIDPQPRGTLLVLDIDAQYEVRSKDPNGRLGHWSASVWGIDGKPLMKDQWSVEEIAHKAADRFSDLCDLISTEL